jgi:hypothetical protein
MQHLQREDSQVMLHACGSPRHVLAFFEIGQKVWRQWYVFVELYYDAMLAIGEVEGTLERA